MKNHTFNNGCKICILLLLTLIGLGNAAPNTGFWYTGNVSQILVADNGWVYFDLSGNAGGVCSINPNNNTRFKFDGNSIAGTLKYGTLVKAKTLNLLVDISYYLNPQGSAPCTDDNMSTVVTLGFH